MSDFLFVSLFVIFLFSIVSLLAWAAVGGYLKWARQKKIMDHPNARSSHTVPTPRGGGFGILSVFFLVYLFTAVFLASTGMALVIVLTGALLAVVGAIDDLKGLPAKIRLIFHLLAALSAIYFFMSEPYYLNLGVFWIKWPTVVVAFLILFTVWMINLYNFMDGIDGLAAGQVISVSIATALFANHFVLDIDDSSRGLLFIFYSLILAASCFGFLIWNWPPAKIFMGDIGSSVLGFLLAAQAIWGSQGYGINFSVFLILNAVFIGDATYTLAVRAYRRVKVWQAHRSHLYQHLDQKGYSRKKIFLALLGYNLFYLLPLAMWVQESMEFTWLALILAYLPIGVLAYFFKAGREVVKAS